MHVEGKDLSTTFTREFVQLVFNPREPQSMNPKPFGIPLHYISCLSSPKAPCFEKFLCLAHSSGFRFRLGPEEHGILREGGMVDGHSPA